MSHTSDHQVELQGTLALSSSYATGGDSLTAAAVGLRVIDAIILTGGAQISGGDFVALEVLKANATLMTATTFPATSIAIRAWKTVSAGVDAELANAVNASTCRVPCIIKGVA